MHRSPARTWRVFVCLIFLALSLRAQKGTDVFQGREVSANEVLVMLRGASPNSALQIQSAQDTILTNPLATRPVSTGCDREAGT